MSTAAAPTAPTPILLDAEEVLLVHDAASVFHIKDINMNHYYTMTAAVVPIVDVHSTGVFGHRVVRHEPPLITVPFILNMKEDIKYCVAAFRQLNNVSSFWGIPLEKVQQFSKTQHTKGFKEEVYFHAVKCSLPSVLSVIPLEEESLLDNFLEILKLCTMFKPNMSRRPKHRIRDLRGVTAICGASPQ